MRWVIAIGIIVIGLLILHRTETVAERKPEIDLQEVHCQRVGEGRVRIEFWANSLVPKTEVIRVELIAWNDRESGRHVMHFTVWRGSSFGSVASVPLSGEVGDCTVEFFLRGRRMVVE